MTARVQMLLKSRASPDMLPFSLCNKKRLAIRHMNRPLFPTTLSIPSYDIGKYVRLRTYQHSHVGGNSFSIHDVLQTRPLRLYCRLTNIETQGRLNLFWNANQLEVTRKSVLHFNTPRQSNFRPAFSIIALLLYRQCAWQPYCFYTQLCFGTKWSHLDSPFLDPQKVLIKNSAVRTVNDVAVSRQSQLGFHCFSNLKP